MKYNIGDKVVPVDKTVDGWEKLENSASWGVAQDIGQDFLYVVNLNIKNPINGKIVPYSCGCCKKGYGDLFNESDLIPYVENKK